MGKMSLHQIVKKAIIADKDELKISFEELKKTNFPWGDKNEELFYGLVFIEANLFVEGSKYLEINDYDVVYGDYEAIVKYGDTYYGTIGTFGDGGFDWNLSSRDFKYLSFHKAKPIEKTIIEWEFSS